MRTRGQRRAERDLLAAAPRALGRAHGGDRDAHAVDAELDLVRFGNGARGLGLDDVLGVER